MLNDSGFGDREHECHCVGERSITRERCEGESFIKVECGCSESSTHVTFTSRYRLAALCSAIPDSHISLRIWLVYKERFKAYEFLEWRFMCEDILFLD